MKCISLGENVDLTAVAAQTAIDLATTYPTFARGFNAVARITHNGLTGASFVAKIQTSPDNSTWTDALTSATGVKPPKDGEITLQRYVRFNVTAAGTAGLGSAYLYI